MRVIYLLICVISPPGKNYTRHLKKNAGSKGFPLGVDLFLFPPIFPKTPSAYWFIITCCTLSLDKETIGLAIDMITTKTYWRKRETNAFYVFISYKKRKKERKSVRIQVVNKLKEESTGA